MALSRGTRIGPFEVVTQIGAGGMGEVFQGRDTRLNRDVALKVLPEAFTRDAERLARFTREAQTLAALNHPNIAHIHGLEEAGAVRALVMEFVDGDDLSRRIGRGAIPLDEALPIAKQIAEAVEAAHEQGIVHRDLKPANVKVRPDGVVKVLDFGLAKALAPDGAGAAAAAMNSPTLTSPAMTQAGMILGTAAYMAPEQARGRAVDKRADIWAFGVVLFEMLTGRRAFPGDDVTDTIVSVVSKDPDWTALPVATPAALRQLIARCLRKDAKTRLRDIGDARLMLEELMSGDAAATSVIAPSPSRPPATLTRALPWILAATTIVFAAAWLAGLAPWRSGSPATRAGLSLTPLSFEQGGQIGAVWSPDGKAVAFGARQKDTALYQVYVRYLNAPVATKITEVAAGVASLIEWTTTGKILFGSPNANVPAVWSVSPVGGEPQLFAELPPNTQLAGAGTIARDGTAIAHLLGGADGVVNLWTNTMPGQTPEVYDPVLATRTIFNAPSVKFSPDGKQLLLVRNTGAGEEAWLMPYPANPANPPRRIFQGMASFSGTPTFGWMPDSRHVVLSTSPGDSPRQLYMADTVSDTFQVFSSGTTPQTTPAISPDGTKLAFLEPITDRDIVEVDLATAMVTPIIATQRAEQMPHWALRESAMVYLTDRNGAHEVWLHRPGQPDRPIVTPNDFPPGTTRGFMGLALSPDATRVIYQRIERGGFAELFMSAVAGGPPVKLVEHGTAGHISGSWSPDGKWFVYEHVQDGRQSLNKVKTTGGASPVVLKADLKSARSWLPAWSPADDWILFSDSGTKIISPDGQTTRQLSATSATAYGFSTDGRTIYGIRRIAADRDRIELFSIDVASGTEKTIGLLAREYAPATMFAPALRLSVTPDGKSVTFGTVRYTANLWLMDDLQSVTAR
jgi:Tol biopolymer transport system component